MSRKPTPKKPAAAKAPAKKAAVLDVAKPVEAVGHTIERALDPLASAIKRAAL
jgi:glutamate N-acetyltransferase/amino-acid N-acetyltransferase